MATTDDDWFTCPNCGEQVRANALACPECGADEETGWSEDAAYDDLDLPGYAQPMGEPSRGGSMLRWGIVIVMLAMIGFVWVVLGF